MEKLIITRHEALVSYLIEERITGEDTPVISHASPDQIRGKHIIGVLPPALAVYAAKITEVPLHLTPEDRGQDLTLKRVREITGPPWTYKVVMVQEGSDYCHICGGNQSEVYDKQGFPWPCPECKGDAK